MNKSISILATVIVAFSLTAFGFANWSPKPVSCKAQPSLSRDLVNQINQLSDPDLVYNIDSRFIHAFTKKDIHNAKNVADLVPDAKEIQVDHFEKVKIALLQDEGELVEISKNTNGDFNEKQLELIASIDYSTNFYIHANFYKKNSVTGKNQEGTIQYYITAVPEQEASYEDGKENLIQYLKKNTKDDIGIIRKDQLKAGQFYFTVTKEGLIKDAYTESSSGYPSIDKLLVDLIIKMPGAWKPAQNAQGKNIDQKLIFFFGKQGC